MCNQRKYVLKGAPVAWARPVPAGKRVYDSQKQLKLMGGIELERQHDNAPLFMGPLHLEARFYFPIPASRTKQLNVLIGTHHYFRPDLSNLIKLIEDMATGIVYKDDCLIASITAVKLYDVEPRTEFVITQLNNYI